MLGVKVVQPPRAEQPAKKPEEHKNSDCPLHRVSRPGARNHVPASESKQARFTSGFRREAQTLYYRLLDPKAEQVLELRRDLFCPEFGGSKD